MKRANLRDVFRGKLLSLHVKRHVFPNGHVSHLEIVRHPGAVLIVPFLDKNKVVLIKQYRPVIDSTIWELPAGTLHKDEIPLRCAKRELIEETGYKAALWKEIGYIYPAPGYTTEKITIFEARSLRTFASAVQEDEIIVATVLAKEKIRRLVRSGRIVDAKTICALSLAGVI